MKILIILLSAIALATPTFATRTYVPHINRIDVAFESGDRISFTTDTNAVVVTGIKVTSRRGVDYSIPSSAFKNIAAPKLDTLKITFHDNAELPYIEGCFIFSFSQSAKDSQDVYFCFEDGIYVGGFQEWVAYKTKKEEKNGAQKAR